MAKVTALRSLSIVDGDRRVTAKPGDSFDVSAGKATRLADAGMVTIVKAKAPTKKK